jgi:hypothetical protein
MSTPKFRRVGNCVCVGDRDWPPFLRDSAVPETTIQLVVDALNAYVTTVKIDAQRKSGPERSAEK